MSGIEALHTELKTYVDRTGAKQSEFQRELGEVRRQLDAIDVAGATRHTSMQTKSLDALLQENESVARLLRDKKGTAVIRFTGADGSLLEKKR